MKKLAKLSIVVGSFVFALSLIFAPFSPVLATGGAGVTPGNPEETLNNVNDTGLAEDLSLPEFVGRIISWVVGVLGVLLVALFVYGGVVYATSTGNEDRIDMGKKIMISAIVGVIIIAVAFAISRYVIQALFTTT